MATSPTMAMAPKQAAWGYSGVWAADDLEELVTMAPASRWMIARLRACTPQLPAGVWERRQRSGDPRARAASPGALRRIIKARGTGARAIRRPDRRQSGPMPTVGERSW